MEGIFVCFFFTGHQVTVMDSARQPEAQNEPRASSKSRTMPPNYCRSQKCRHQSFVRIAVFAIAQSCLAPLTPPLYDWLSVSDFPLFAALTEILSLRIEQKLKGAKNQTELNRFPPILSNQKSHTTQLSPNWQSFETLESLSRFLVHFKPQSYWRANMANQDFFWFKKFLK